MEFKCTIDPYTLFMVTYCLMLSGYVAMFVKRVFFKEIQCE